MNPIRTYMLTTITAAALLAACAGDRITDPTAGPGADSTITDHGTTAAVQHGYFATPNGAPTADGSELHPWDLATALNGANGRVQAGDTVWLRSGTYRGDFRSSVSGAAGRPVVFRQYAGERATIDGTLRADGADVVFWGFEVMRSAPTGRLPGLESRGPRQKFINLVIHDAAQQGITFWDEAVDAELYGNLVYNNGTHENLDHGTYVHNMSGTKLITDNVFFDNLAYGIHVYAGPTDGTQRNVHVVGNVAFNNGTISTRYSAKGNILIGADSPDEGMRAVDNMLYFSGNAGENLRVGYTAANRDVTVTGNMAWGGATAFVVGQWASATIQNNTFGGSADMVSLLHAPGSYSWSGNTYYRADAAAWRTADGTARTLSDWTHATGLGAGDKVLGTVPTTPQVFVRANKYEPGRALVVVYNFGGQSAVSVDLSSVLRNGQQFEIRNVQNFYGAPVTSGTYAGGSVSVPMSGVNPPAPLGRTTPMPPRTGPGFDTFVVVPR